MDTEIDKEMNKDIEALMGLRQNWLMCVTDNLPNVQCSWMGVQVPV